MRILFSAGEASGDSHAAAVIRQIRQQTPVSDIHGIAGPAMRQAGCFAIASMDDLNVMGMGDVIRALPRIHRVERAVLAWAFENRPDVAILVDFPGFHMRLGRKLRQLGVPVIQYIAPKLWAWGAWRAKRLSQSQDCLASILPFEPDWFGQRGIRASYVGNPSMSACHGGWSAAELRHRLGLEEGAPLFALLPGSRPGELRRHVSLLAGVLERIRRDMPDLPCVVPVAAGVDVNSLVPLEKAGALFVDRMEDGFTLRVDAAVAVSGTATLELALWDVPSVLIYRASPLMAFMARRLVKLNCAGLANILLDDRPVMPELFQAQATVENIVSRLVPLLQNNDAARVQREHFAKLKTVLGDMNPAVEVASLIRAFHET